MDASARMDKGLRVCEGGEGREGRSGGGLSGSKEGSDGGVTVGITPGGALYGVSINPSAVIDFVVTTEVLQVLLGVIGPRHTQVVGATL